MPNRFEDLYRFRPDTELTDEVLNLRFRDVDDRLSAAEVIRLTEDRAFSIVLDRVLSRSEAVIGTLRDRLLAITQLQWLTAHSTTSRTLALDASFALTILAADRDLFAPGPFAVLTRTASPDDYAVVQTLAYDRVLGQWDVRVEAFEGDPGPHNDWLISAIAGATLAQLALLDDGKVARSDAVDAKVDAETARDLAQAAATTATTQATAATTAAGQAATSLSDLQVAAEQAIGSLLPATFDAGGEFFTVAASPITTPPNLAGPGISFPTVTGVGKVAQAAAVAVAVVTQGAVPFAAGRTWRATAVERMTADETNSSEVGTHAMVGFAAYDASEAYLGWVTAADRLIQVSAGWQTVTGDVDAAAIAATYPAVTWLRPIAPLNYDTDVNPSNGTQQCRLLRIEDVTSVVAAAASAAAAAASAASLDTSLLAPKANPSFTGAIGLGGQLALTGVISPASLTAQQDDYNPSGLSTAAVARLSSNASRAITGFQGGTAGRLMYLFNVGANPILLANENGASTAANRFSIGVDRTLAPGRSIALIYDATSSRWRDLLALLKASASDHWLGTDDEHYATAKSLSDAAAFVAATGGETSGGTITFDWNLGINRSRVLTANTTFAAPLHPIDGQTYSIKSKQPASGGPYTGAFDPVFDFGAAYATTPPALSTGANKVDRMWAQWDAAEGKYAATFFKAA